MVAHRKKASNSVSCESVCIPVSWGPSKGTLSSPFSLTLVAVPRRAEGCCCVWAARGFLSPLFFLWTQGHETSASHSSEITYQDQRKNCLSFNIKKKKRQKFVSLSVGQTHNSNFVRKSDLEFP